jgi:O-6-methylguanine DNA methyltransferase
MPAKTLVRYTPVQTPIGELVAAATDTHLVLLEYERRTMYEQQLERVRRALDCEFEPGESPVFDTLRTQLDEYFAGDRRDFDVPMHVPGTPFQTKVWSELQRIPSGTTTTYARLAERIGHPSAVRAVGRANGDNRVAILIPCHRVVGTGGTLVGYGGGLWRKRKLLELEGKGLTFPLEL